MSRDRTIALQPGQQERNSVSKKKKNQLKTRESQKNICGTKEARHEEFTCMTPFYDVQEETNVIDRNQNNGCSWVLTGKELREPSGAIEMFYVLMWVMIT